MTIYIIIALVLAAFSYFQTSKNRDKLLLIALGGLFVVSAWRGFSVGTDTLNYKLTFDYIGNDIRFISIRTREFLFPYLMFFIKSIDLGYRWFVVISAAIFSIFAWIICKKNEHSLMCLLMFWLLGYYFQFYNISRQMIAVLIVLSSFFVFKQRKYVLWFFFIIGASLVHTSALIAFLYYPLSKITITNNRIGVVVAVLVVSFILPFLLNTRSFVDVFENIFGRDTYEMYYQSENKGMFSWNRLLLNVYFVVLIGLDRERNKNIYATFIVSYLVILNLFPFSGIINRIALYFGVFQLLYLPTLRGQSVLNRFLIAVYLLSVFALFLITNNCDIIPYVFGGD